MSMGLSIRSTCSSSEGEGDGGDDAGDRSASDVATGMVAFGTEAEEQEFGMRNADSGDCFGRDQNIDGEVKSGSRCDEGSYVYSLDCSRECFHRVGGDIDGSNATLLREECDESFVAAQEPEEGGSEVEGANRLAIERVQFEETALIEAAPSSERRGLRAAAPPKSEELLAREPLASPVEETVGAIPPSVPGYCDTGANKGAHLPVVGGHDDEVSASSFMGKPIVAPTANGSFNSNDALPTVNSAFNEMQSNGEGEQGPPQDNDRNPIADRSPKINLGEYDAKGRCVRHPQVRLSKKKVLGGWKGLLSACPNCCVEELYRIQLAENKRGKSPRQQQRSQECRPLLGRAASKHNFQGTAITKAEENTASLTVSSRGSNYQHGADKKRATTHKQKKSYSKGTYRQHSSRQEQPKTQNKPISMYAARMYYTDENNEQGIYNGQINANLMPHGLGTMVYCHDGSTSEGEWEDGRYRPHSTLIPKCGRRRCGKGRSKCKGRDANRNIVRPRQYRRAREPLAPFVKEPAGAILPSVPDYYSTNANKDTHCMSLVGGHDDEVSVLSFMGKPIAVPKVNGSFNSNDTVPTVKSELNKIQFNGEGEQEIAQDDNQNPIVDPLPKINPNDNDAKARCVHRPQVRRRKKKVLGGWKRLMRVCPKWKRKSNRKGKDRRNGSRPQEQPKTQNERAGMYAVRMQYTDENNRQGIYDGEINASLMPHGLGTMVYSHDGSTSEGAWEDGRYRPQSTSRLKSGRIRHGKGRSKGKGCDANRGVGRWRRCKERRRGLRSEAPPNSEELLLSPSRQHRRTREPPAPSVEETAGAILPSVPGNFNTSANKGAYCMPFVGGHDDEASAVSFTGKPIVAHTVKGSFNSNDTVPTVDSEFNETQSDGDGEQEGPEDYNQNPIRSLKIAHGEFDKKGRCVPHPQVRLRKKRGLGLGRLSQSLRGSMKGSLFSKERTTTNVV